MEGLIASLNLRIESSEVAASLAKKDLASHLAENKAAQPSKVPMIVEEPDNPQSLAADDLRKAQDYIL
jgi:hypothetical protein